MFYKYQWCVAVLFIMLVLLLVPNNSEARPNNIKPWMEPLYVIDTPTAGILNRGISVFTLGIYPKDGFLFQAAFAWRRRFCVGISVSAQNAISYGDLESNVPGFLIKYRLWEETFTRPALAIGLDTQGFGEYYDFDENGKEVKRYLVKSKGLYLVGSKNIPLSPSLGWMGVHAGINMSFETADGQEQPSIFIGIDKNIGGELYLLLEYDTALNDQQKEYVQQNGIDVLAQEQFGEGGGILNAGLRWILPNDFFIQANLRNLTGTMYVPGTGAKIGREIRICIYDVFDKIRGR